MHPKTGGRVVLDLEPSAGPEGVIYTAALYTADAVWQGRAEIRHADGQVSWREWTPSAGGPPEWLVKIAQAFLRTEWKARQGTDPEAWPARINRWREER
jgi:hypothetical protein